MPEDLHPLADLPVSKRIDIAFAVANAMGGRIPVDVLADMAGCSEAAIYARSKAALDAFRAKALQDSELRSLLNL